MYKYQISYKKPVILFSKIIYFKIDYFFIILILMIIIINWKIASYFNHTYKIYNRIVQCNRCKSMSFISISQTKAKQQWLVNPCILTYTRWHCWAMKWSFKTTVSISSFFFSFFCRMSLRKHIVGIAKLKANPHPTKFN